MITQDRHQRRLNRNRRKISLSLGLPRLTVFRSNRYLWAQIIDDQHGKTIVASSSKTLSSGKNNLSAATKVGTDIATKAVTQKIIKVRFDRGSYKYHGRIKALANAAREGGLKF